MIFVLFSGVPNLRRAELETACEDFSNVIGSTTVGTLYKGTLSSGVEIAVISFSTASFKDWPKNLEAQFREKVQIKWFSRYNYMQFPSVRPLSLNILIPYDSRLQHYQKWITKILWAFLDIVRKRSLSQGWWCLSMLLMAHFLSTCTVSSYFDLHLIIFTV